MRIALLAYACDPAAGSEAGAGWQWARGLADRGHRVELVTRDDPGANARVRAELDRRGDGRLALHVVPRPDARRPEGVGSRPGADLRTSRQYHGWLARVDRLGPALPPVDLVHHVTYGSVRAGSALLGTGAPHVFGPVSGFHRPARGLRPLLGPARLRERAREVHGWTAVRRPGRARRTLRDTGLVLAANSDTARAVGPRCRRAELLAADGLARSYLADRVPDRDLGRPVVLWVGSLQAIKAPVLALDAFAAVRRRRPEARLRMVGDGPLRAAVARRRADLGLTGAVELSGRVPWAELAGAYDEASVLLFTSIRDSFGAQCLEAWGRALPSVGFRQHGLADFAPPDGAVLVEPGSAADAPGALADAVEAVVKDPAHHRRLAAAALHHAAGFTWEAKLDRAEAAYRRAGG